MFSINSYNALFCFLNSYGIILFVCSAKPPIRFKILLAEICVGKSFPNLCNLLNLSASTDDLKVSSLIATCSNFFFKLLDTCLDTKDIVCLDAGNPANNTSNLPDNFSCSVKSKSTGAVTESANISKALKNSFLSSSVFNPNPSAASLRNFSENTPAEYKVIRVTKGAAIFPGIPNFDVTAPAVKAVDTATVLAPVSATRKGTIDCV